MYRPQQRLWTVLGILAAAATTTWSSGVAFHMEPPPQRRTLHRKQQQQQQRPAVLTMAAAASSQPSNDKNDGQQQHAQSSRSLKFKNFDNMLDAFSNEPVLVYFTSLSCGPCRLQTKELSTVRDLLLSGGPTGQKAWTVLAIDTERFPHVGTRYEIAKLPCLLLLVNGQVLHRLEGLTKAHDVVEQFHAKINSLNNNNAQQQQQQQSLPPPPT
jgi:thioredoxin-like negative regulator of GroEL